MMTEPLFSIITVTRNNLGGLRSTYESLESQNYRDYEWLIVDGASKDGTLAFLSENNLMDHGLSERDHGIYDAMNKGIKRSTGRYIVFLNAGDRFADEKALQIVAEKLQYQEYDFIYGDSLESDGFYKKARAPQTIKFGMFTHHQAMLYARKTLSGLRYDTSYPIAADYDLTARFLLKAQNTLYVPAPLCLFESGGISQRRMSQGRLEQYTIRQRLSLCGPMENRLVYMGQSCTALLRKTAPSLYASLKNQARRAS